MDAESMAPHLAQYSSFFLFTWLHHMQTSISLPATSAGVSSRVSGSSASFRLSEIMSFIDLRRYPQEVHRVTRILFRFPQFGQMTFGLAGILEEDPLLVPTAPLGLFAGTASPRTGGTGFINVAPHRMHLCASTGFWVWHIAQVF